MSVFRRVLCIGMFLIYTTTDQLAWASTPEAQEINWPLLREWDLKSDTKTLNLVAISGKTVKIPGFLVPLDDFGEGGSEYLLVPSPQACIHAPPPPRNQMVLVRMTKRPGSLKFGTPMLVSGTFSFSPTESVYGNVTYSIVADSVAEYSAENETH